MMPVDRFFLGFKFIFAGISIIKSNKDFKKWVFAPFLINLALLLAGMSVGIGYISVWTQSAVGFLFSLTTGFWFQLIYYPLLLIFWLSFVVILIYAIFLLSTIIASPFNSILAERALIAKNMIPDKPFHFQSWLMTTLRMFVISIARALIFALLGVVIFVLSFIPFINFIAAYLAFVIIAFDCMDYSFEALEMSLGQRFSYFKKNIWEFSGMGAAVGLTLLVPGLTLLVLPYSVTGCAEVIAEIKKHDS